MAGQWLRRQTPAQDRADARHPQSARADARQPQSARGDARHPQSARVYDYWLGGKDNFSADRDAAQEAAAVNPGLVANAAANRAFLGRAVHYLASRCGISQFLDIGAGLPAACNTHEVAQAVIPAARDRAQVSRFFTGLELAEPGVVQPQQWHPEPGQEAPPEVAVWCGVARKS
jgi:hypothetical protein